MDHAAVNRTIQRACGELLVTLNGADFQFDPRSEELANLIHDAEAREHRRAAHNARDASCYRLGAAFEPTGFGIDPVFLTGWLATGGYGLLLLARVSLSRPELTITDLLKRLQVEAIGRELRHVGVWIRWQWLKALYDNEVEAFRRSAAYARGSFRKKPATPRQGYLIAAISEFLEVERPSFPNRGDAFDWIERQGGNPRFANEPPHLSLADLQATFG